MSHEHSVSAKSRPESASRLHACKQQPPCHRGVARGVNPQNEKLLRRVTTSLAIVLRELGKIAFLWAMQNSVVSQIEGHLDNLQAMLKTQTEAAQLEADLVSLKTGLADALDGIQKCCIIGKVVACLKHCLAGGTEKQTQQH